MSFEQIIKETIREVIREELPQIISSIMNPQPTKPIMELEEAAGVLGVSKSRMYELVRTDGFPAFKEGKRWAIITHLFYKWIEEKGVS